MKLHRNVRRRQEIRRRIHCHGSNASCRYLASEKIHEHMRRIKKFLRTGTTKIKEARKAYAS